MANLLAPRLHVHCFQPEDIHEPPPRFLALPDSATAEIDAWIDAHNPPSLSDYEIDQLWAAEQERREAEDALADAALERAAQAPRLPEVHPGAPGYGRVILTMRIVKRTPKATLVELPDDPRGRVWVSRKHVPHGSVGPSFGTERLSIPIWLYRKIKDQL